MALLANLDKLILVKVLEFQVFIGKNWTLPQVMTYFCFLRGLLDCLHTWHCQFCALSEWDHAVTKRKIVVCSCHMCLLFDWPTCFVVYEWLATDRLCSQLTDEEAGQRCSSCSDGWSGECMEPVEHLYVGWPPACATAVDPAMLNLHRASSRPCKVCNSSSVRAYRLRGDFNTSHIYTLWFVYMFRLYQKFTHRLYV